MPAITSMARACALALAALGLTVSTVTALPASAATTDSASTSTQVVSTTHVDAKHASKHQHKQKQKQKARERAKKRQQRIAARVNTRVLGALGTAMRQRGDWYSYGAAGPDRFDCSGLVYYSYRRAGFPVPRTSGAQSGFVRRIAKAAMRPGDLMFFYGSGGVYHAAIFLRWTHGRALMVHAPGTGQRVQVASPWTSQWFGGTLRR